MIKLTHVPAIDTAVFVLQWLSKQLFNAEKCWEDEKG